MVKKSRGGQTLNSSQKRKQSYLRRKKIGAVLIEFAFAIPVFLVLMYYIHDLPKYKLMQRKNQFVANILAATIQNISKQRQTAGQNLTQTDIKQAIRLCALSIFPGMTQYAPKGGATGYALSPFGYIPMVNLFVFSGTGTNTATVKYKYRFYPNNTVDNLYRMFYNNDDGIIKSKETNATSIYPDFQISAGETKCFITFRLYNDDSMYLGTTGISTTTISKGELFGFLFYTPIARSQGYFYAVTIFTPVWDFADALPN